MYAIRSYYVIGDATGISQGRRSGFIEKAERCGRSEIGGKPNFPNGAQQFVEFFLVAAAAAAGYDAVTLRALGCGMAGCGDDFLSAF